MLAHWVWLAHRPNLPDWLKWKILQSFGDPEKVYFEDSFRNIEGLTREGFESLMDKNLGPSQEILEKCCQKQIHLVTIQDELYPRRLKNISDPPLILYYKGQLPDFDGNAVIGVVGTRHATPYGLQVAKRMGYQLAKSGGIVVSGMALGIDAMAMSGALLGNGPVVGVLGCGADRIYPMKNKALFEDMAGYGCILSEYPPETPAIAWHFPRRNRIISGLSSGVLVVEAPIKSGALITAHQALDQGRDVFVVPGNVGVPACEGSNRLLREGAIAAGCGWDVLSEYEMLYPGKLHEVSAEPETGAGKQARVAQAPETPEKQMGKSRKKTENSRVSREQNQRNQDAEEKLTIDKEASQPYIDINDILQRCNSQEKAIVLALKEGEALVDDVIAQTGLKTQEVLAGLTMLEIKGILRRLPGRRITLRK